MIYKMLRKQDGYFSVFNELADLAKVAATELRRVATSLPLRQPESDSITELEAGGDELLVSLNLRLAGAFITPLDREDIHRLATGLKGILDHLHGIAHRLAYFEVDAAPGDAIEMIDLATTAITAIGEALRCLQGAKSMAHLRQVVTDCERRGDELSRRAIGQMFKDRMEIYELLKWKELYERLESLLDCCEEGFLIVETLGVKYA